LLKVPKTQQPQHQIINGQAVTIDPSGKATAAPIEGFVAPQAKQNLPKTQIVNGQVVTIDPSTGQATAAPIQGLQQDPVQAANLRNQAIDQSLRARAIAVQESADRRLSSKISAGLEKVLLTSQDSTVASQRRANKFDLLANDFEKLKIQGGLKSTAEESLKSLLGTQDAISEFSRQVNETRMSEAIKLLPPGAASDADIRLVTSTQINANASAEQTAAYLRGAAKISRIEAGYNQFKSDFISNKSTGKGLNQAWRTKVNAPTLKRDVSVAELYETAQNRGTTPEDIANQLGIKGPLYQWLIYWMNWEVNLASV